MLRMRRGSLFLHAILMVLFLLATSIAFMSWAVAEKYQGQVSLAHSQALYVAQYGVLNEALGELRSRPECQLPPGVEYLHPGVMRNTNGDIIGEYDHVKVSRVIDASQESNVFYTSWSYDLSARGKVEVKEPLGGVNEVTRQVTMRAHLRTYANYLYLTDRELTEYNEIIWFWTPDVLTGRTHSNDRIGIKYAPTFNGPVSTCAEAFIQGAGYSPHFTYEPIFNAPEVHFPSYAENVRNCAISMGHYYHDYVGTRMTRMKGIEAGWMLQQYIRGEPYDSAMIVFENLIPYHNIVFVDGDLEIYGEQVSGVTTVGCSGSMELIDNIKLADVPLDEPNETLSSLYMLGLVSEGQIIIKDTPANGQGNGLHASQGNHDGSHIMITAAIVALGESFTFEHQNDTWDEYRWCDPLGEHPGNQDERGEIILRGSVTQKRRGYVHRSNCGGTGYAKNYLYDIRLDDSAPPCFVNAIDGNGAAMFDIVAWREDVVPDPL